jgi:hypothetical protein
VTYNQTLPAGWVRSEPLDWFPKTDVNPYEDLVTFTRKYSISFEFCQQVGWAPGGYQIRLIGHTHDVLRAIVDNWCDNEIGANKEFLARTYIGDALAEHRYTTGCKRTSSDEPNVYDFAWEVHFKRAGVDQNAIDPTDFDEANTLAIDLLVEAGYEPSDGTKETEASDFAQTYLALALSHCPKLAEVIKMPEPVQHWRHSDNTECETEVIRYQLKEEGEVNICDHDRRVYRV